MADLTTLAVAQAWAGSAATQGILDAASAQIQAWLGYQLASQTYTRTFNGRGETALMVPDRPLTGVASLSIDGVAIPASPGAPQPGYLFDEQIIYLLGGYRFCRGPLNVVVTYTAGFTTIPADVVQACLVLVKTIVDRAAREADLLVQKAGDTEERFQPTSPSSISSPLPADVIAYLQPYRRVAPC